jgi:hypothetical protein
MRRPRRLEHFTNHRLGNAWSVRWRHGGLGSQLAADACFGLSSGTTASPACRGTVTGATPVARFRGRLTSSAVLSGLQARGRGAQRQAVVRDEHTHQVDSFVDVLPFAPLVWLKW